MLWYLSTPSEMPLKEPDFQGVNTSLFLEVKASQVFLHCWAESLILAPNNSCFAAGNSMAVSEIVWPWQGDALRELSTSLERQDLLDRVSASRTRRYSLLGWSQHLCTAALCCAISAAHLIWSSTWHSQTLGLIWCVWNLVGTGQISQAFTPPGEQVQPGTGELTSIFIFVVTNYS